MFFFKNPFSNPFFIPSMISLGGYILLSLILYLSLSFRCKNKTIQSQGLRYFSIWFCVLFLFLFSVLLGKASLLLFVVILIFFAINNYIRLLCIPRFFRLMMIFNVIISIFTIIFAPSFFGALPFVYFLTIIISSTLYRKVEALLNRIALTFLGSVWFIFSLFHLVRIGNYPNGEQCLIYLPFAIAFSDSLAHVLRSYWINLKRFHPFDLSYVGILIGNVIGAFLGLALLTITGIGLTSLNLLLLTLLIGFSVALGDWTLAAVKHTVMLSDDTDSIPIETSSLGLASKFLIPAVIVYWYFINILR